jgi:hypothetical protein
MGDRRGDPTVRSARAVAISAYRTGTSDLFIQLWLAEQEAVKAGGGVRAADEIDCKSDCTLCFGSQKETVAGKGARPCPNREERRRGRDGESHGR